VYVPSAATIVSVLPAAVEAARRVCVPERQRLGDNPPLAGVVLGTLLLTLAALPLAQCRYLRRARWQRRHPRTLLLLPLLLATRRRHASTHLSIHTCCSRLSVRRHPRVLAAKRATLPRHIETIHLRKPEPTTQLGVSVSQAKGAPHVYAPAPRTFTCAAALHRGRMPLQLRLGDPCRLRRRRGGAQGG